VLGREGFGFTQSSGFFDAISADPLLNRIKLIAEPWDLGTYQVGNFPIDWSEWNGKFRDSVRKFIKSDAGQIQDLACRLTGSSDFYGDDGRSAYNSINFVICHDGFTMCDLVSYDGKHNEANLENNSDGPMITTPGTAAGRANPRTQCNILAQAADQEFYMCAHVFRRNAHDPRR